MYNMGPKKLNFNPKDFTKFNAQEAGFQTKALALKFLKSSPKSNFSKLCPIERSLEEEDWRPGGHEAAQGEARQRDRQEHELEFCARDQSA